MSDYPMLISNKLHSFRNFTFAKIETFSVMVLKLFVIIGLMNVSPDEVTDFIGVLLFILLV